MCCLIRKSAIVARPGIVNGFTLCYITETPRREPFLARWPPPMHVDCEYIPLPCMCVASETSLKLFRQRRALQRARIQHRVLRPCAITRRDAKVSKTDVVKSSPWGKRFWKCLFFFFVNKTRHDALNCAAIRIKVLIARRFTDYSVCDAIFFSAISFRIKGRT